VALVLAVAGYPELSDADRDGIESFRSSHDPQARRIDLHFTLVFPAQAPLAELRDDLASAALSTAPIDFTIRGAEAMDRHVFLVPDEGRAEIAALHDRLYAGVLKSQLRNDPPYVPHITVAAKFDPAECERLARELGTSLGVVRGRLTHLDLVDVSPPRVRTIERFALCGTKA